MGSNEKSGVIDIAQQTGTSIVIPMSLSRPLVGFVKISAKNEEKGEPIGVPAVF